MIQNFQLTWTKYFLFYKTSNLQKREKDSTVLSSGTHARYQNYFGCAAQKDRSSGNENKNKPLRYFFFKFAHAQCVSPLCLPGSFRVKFRTTSVASKLHTHLFIPARCVSFSTSYSFFLIYWFLYCGATVPRLYQRGEKNNFS